VGPAEKVTQPVQGSPAYSYAGTQQGARAALACLDSARVESGHVAVWVGASAPDATSWIQVGLMSDGGEPHAYAETAATGFRDLGRVRFGRCLELGVMQTAGGTWRVTLGGRLVRYENARLPADAVTMATSETLGNSRMVYRLEPVPRADRPGGT
jgi:hypothetical protein